MTKRPKVEIQPSLFEMDGMVAATPQEVVRPFEIPGTQMQGTAEPGVRAARLLEEVGLSDSPRHVVFHCVWFGRQLLPERDEVNELSFLLRETIPHGRDRRHVLRDTIR